MSYSFSDFISCPDLQGRLEEGYFKGDPQMFPGHINTLRAVTSPMNEQGILQRQIDTGNGHYRAVEVVYQPRMTDTGTSSSAELNCAAGPVYGETSKLYNIDPTVGASRRWSFSLDELAPRCESDENYVARQLAYHLQALKRKMNTEAVSFIGTNFGKFSTGAGSTVIGGNLLTTKTKNLTTGVYLDDYLSDVTYQYQLAEGWDRPIVVGGELSHKYMTAVRNSCCATLNVDLQSMMSSDAQMYFFFEPTSDATFGTGEFAFFAPGAIQLIRYNAFKGANGIRVINDQAIKKGTIVDPETGLEFDYYAQLDCNQWKFFLGLAFEYVGMPDDMFFATDALNDVNYIFNGKVSN